MTTLPYLDADAVLRAISPRAAVEAIEVALRSGFDPSVDPERVVVPTVHGQMLLMPSEVGPAAGVKIATVAPANPDRGLPRIQGTYVLFAAETLARLGMPLAGDLIVNTVSEEESTGAGGLAMARTINADAAIVPEPSGLDVWVACRGSLLPTITVEGRAGHAGLPPRPPEEGGAVNAIEKMAIVLLAIAELRGEWQRSPAHPFLSPGDCVPTIVAGGEWIVSYPALCRLDCHIEYLPGQADEHGWGSLVEQEFTEWILRATAADPWLGAHPPRIDWLVGGVPPAEVPVDDPIVTTALGAARAVGRASELGGLENWHDGATLIVEAGIPSICLGPGDINVAHTIDESVPIVDLVACAQAIAVTAMRFCR